MRLYHKDITNKKVILYMVDDSDHVSPETGLTLTVRVSKNGGAFAAGAGSVAELEDGLYAYTLGAGDVDTLGPVVIKATATGADQCVVEGRVVAFDPDDASALGLGRLDAAITSRLAAADVPNNFKDLAITETEGKVTVDNVDDCKATGFSTHSPEDVKSAIESEGSKLSIVHSKLPTYGIADQSLLTAIGNSLVEHRNNYTFTRAAKLDNLDAAITSRLAANAVPAHFGDLAITETTGKVTVDNVDDCKADVTNVTVGTNLDKTGYALTTSERSSIATAVWSATTRTLSSFGGLVADMAAGVWGAMTRTLTAGTRDIEIDTIVSKLPAGDMAEQTTLNAVDLSLTQHRSAYTTERAAKLDNLDATISSRLAASAAPAHFGDLAITETTGKVTVNNVDECKADVSGLATSAEIAACQTTAEAIKTQTDKMDFTGSGSMLKSESTNMRGTDGAYTGTPPTTGEIAAALKASTGWTAGNTMTLAEVVKILAAWSAGQWRDKDGAAGTYQVLDPDDGTTVICEITPSETTPQKTVSIV